MQYPDSQTSPAKPVKPMADDGSSVAPGLADVIRDRLIDEMQAIFGPDQRRIAHALSVLDYAERIHAVEGGNAMVVAAAAILHDIGIVQAERKYGSAAGHLQEIEGPPVACPILYKHLKDPSAVQHVLDIIAHHHNGRYDSREFHILRDADMIVNIAEEMGPCSREKLERVIDKSIVTAKGRRIAAQRYLNEP